MLDIKFIRENLDMVKEGARKKRIDLDVMRLIELDDRRKEKRTEWEQLRARQKSESKRVPKADPEEKVGLLKELNELSARVSELEPEVKSIEEELKAGLLVVPNVPLDVVPEGKDDADNVEIRRVGEVPAFDFPIKDHIELGESLDILDFQRAARVSGSRTYYLKNEAVLLELALMHLSLDHIMSKGFSPYIPPYLVKRDPMVGTAYFPGGEEQAYHMERDGLYLIGTSEVPITSLHAGEILSHKDLPYYYAGFSACFRREAGTYGKDTKGLYRMHQFHKVEQVVICQGIPEVSQKEHDHILNNSEELLQMLELPYRVVEVCGGDLGLGQVRKYDIESWMPSRKSYGETHSASNFHEYQARRLNLRYRDPEGKVHFAHTLNNTVLASPRIFIPLLELNQQEDGTIRIPEVLRKYMGGREFIGKK